MDSDSIPNAVRANLNFVVNDGQLKQKIRSGRREEHWHLLSPSVDCGKNKTLKGVCYHKSVGGLHYVVVIVNDYVFSHLNRESVVEFCRDFRSKLNLSALEINKSVKIKQQETGVSKELTKAIRALEAAKLKAVKEAQMKAKIKAGAKKILDKFPFLKKKK